MKPFFWYLNRWIWRIFLKWVFFVKGLTLNFFQKSQKNYFLIFLPKCIDPLITKSYLQFKTFLETLLRGNLLPNVRKIKILIANYLACRPLRNFWFSLFNRVERNFSSDIPINDLWGIFLKWFFFCQGVNLEFFFSKSQKNKFVIFYLNA